MKNEISLTFKKAFYTVETFLIIQNFLKFQLSDHEGQTLPTFPPPKDTTPGPGQPGQDSGPILPVPVGIRPNSHFLRLE